MGREEFERLVGERLERLGEIFTKDETNALARRSGTATASLILVEANAQGRYSYQNGSVEQQNEYFC